MKTPFIIISAMALAAGMAMAGDTDGGESVRAISNQPQAVEFTPMTRSERLRQYLTGTFGPTSLARAAASAGFNQLRESPTEWGQDGDGYAKRLGNSYAKHVIRGTLQYGASTALHEDDRYLASGQTGFWNRTRYAIASAFLARRDNGDRTFAFARIGSAAGSALISRAWQPPSASGPGSGASAFGFTVASDLASNVVREFWPDLKRHFRRN